MDATTGVFSLSTISRYRKPGGFRQLMTLLEGSPKSKQDQLLKVIESENLFWFQALKKRMLTFQKVLQWTPENVEKVLQHIPETTWLSSLFHLPEGERLQYFRAFVQFLPYVKQRQLEDVMGTLNPTPTQVDAAQIVVLKKVRELQAAGVFMPEKIDPSLAVNDLDKLVI